MRRVRVRVVELAAADIIRVETVEVEELGIGEELQVWVGDIDVAVGGQLVGGRDGVEVGEVLRHVRGAAAGICRHDGWWAP